MAELANRPQLESSFGRKLATLNAKHRRRLKSLLGDPPDVSNVPASFWQEVEQDVSAEIALLLLLVISASSSQHGARDGDAVAQQLASGMAAQSGASIASTGQGILQTAGKNWASRIERGLVVPRQEVSDVATSIFGPSRVEQIAVSEVSRGQQAGAKWSIDELARGGDGASLEKAAGRGAGVGDELPEGAKIVKYWRHSQVRPARHAGAAVKPCPICTPRLDKPESQWAGKEPGFAHPH